MIAKEATERIRPSPRMVAEAAAWITCLHGQNRTAQLEAGFREWLAADAGHAAAFEHMTETWETVLAIPVEQLPRVVVRERAAAPRTFVRFAVTFSVCALVAFASIYLSRDPSYVTAIGEQRILNLDDGSRVSLNSQSRMTLHFVERERRIRLAEGEAYFEVAPDARRPFVVVAGGHRVTALGTAFVVRYHDDSTAVTLVHGKVAVTTPGPSTPAAEPVVLTPGERLTFTYGSAPQLDRPRVDAVDSWRRGELIFDNTRLADAVAEMNRHDKIQLVIDDPAIGELLVSGIYRTGDSPDFARMVARMYGIKMLQEDRRIHLRR